MSSHITPRQSLDGVHHPRPSSDYSHSPSSSITAVSRSPSPPFSSTRRGSKLFGFPLSVMASPKDGDNSEKFGLPGPGPSTMRHTRNSSLSALGVIAHGTGVRAWRRRKLLPVIVIGALFIGGVFMGYLDPGRLVPESIWESGSMGTLSAGVVPSAETMACDDDACPVPVDPASEATSEPTTTNYRHVGEVKLPQDPIYTWGLDLASDKLLAGLRPWPPNPPQDETVSALSDLGHFADNIYNVGPLDIFTYREQLYEFAETAFPKTIVGQVKTGLKRYLGTEEEAQAWTVHKNVWQTDKDTRFSKSAEVGSWKSGSAKSEGWKYDLFTDAQADKWISAHFATSRIHTMWDALPSGILRSDALRYLLLLVEGGIYSDTDTRLIKSPSHWGGGPKLWRDGAGWTTDEQVKLLAAGSDLDTVLGKPSIVVGIEADVGGRADWFDWWPRPIQIVQWTMASAPYHPITLSAALRILHSTAKAVDWSHEHAFNVKALRTLGRYDDMLALYKTTVLEEPKGGGPVGVMAWTGPGVWTDAVLSYLRVKYGMQWTDLKDIRQPLRVGDVVILPVTGFSPGVGNFGSQATWNPEAMVEHGFRGSWKDGGK